MINRVAILNVFCGVVLSAFSGDMLYLFLLKQWYDPNPRLEFIEVVVCSFFFAYGILVAIINSKRIIE